MENFKLELKVSLEPDVAIAIRKYLGTVPSDQVGLINIVGLENAIQDAANSQIKMIEEERKIMEEESNKEGNKNAKI